MAILIRKAKLAKSGTLEVSYTDEDGNEVNLKGSNVCHADCKAAFDALIPFFADITEQKEAQSIDWNELESAQNTELLRNLSVTGFSLTDDEINPMVTLVGKRILKTSKMLNICAPGTSLNPELESYGRCEDLDIAIQRLIFEVDAYVTERKWGVKQTQIDFDAEDPFAQAEVTMEVALGDDSAA